MLLAAVDDAGTNKALALERAADAVDFQIRGMKALLKNLVMPALALPIVGAMCVITSEIVVGIAKNSPPEVWKGFNGLVRWLAEWINANAVSIPVAIVVLVAVTVYILPRWKGPARLKADKAVGFSLYRDYNAAVVLSALAMMISSGKTLRQALDDLRATASPWLRWQLQRVINSLEENPTDYMAAFSRGLMPPTVRARLASLLDSSKSFDEALITLGTSEVGRLETNVKLSAEAVNYSLTGVLVAVAVILSIGQMTIASALSSASEPSKLLQRR
jgi:type II secretory pathway component PulF